MHRCPCTSPRKGTIGIDRSSPDQLQRPLCFWQGFCSGMQSGATYRADGDGAYDLLEPLRCFLRCLRRDQPTQSRMSDLGFE